MSFPSEGRLASVLQPHVDNGTMAGAVVLVADRERVLTLDTVGYADLATKEPMKADSLFWIASMTKPIIATAFMMLVEERKAHPNDPISKYIPGFASLYVLQTDGTLAPPNHPILIRELLSHTSGLRFLNTKDANIIDAVPLRESVENDLLEPLLAQPGTTYLYSNEGIDTVGRLIEILSGQPLEIFLQERLFSPLGMVDTTFFPDTAQLARLAKSYTLPEGATALEEMPIHYMKQPLSRTDRYPAPGGGLFSTAVDVARFCQMILNGGTFEGKTYLTPLSVREMTVKQTGPLLSESYGFGFSASDGKSYGHGGAHKTNMTVDHEQIQVFLVQHGRWGEVNPHADFEAACRRFYPGAGTQGVEIEGARVR